MKKVFTLSLMCALAFMAMSSQAQRVVNIPPTTDFENPTDLLPHIMGDTTDQGERVDNNTIYKLENGGFYITSGRLDNKPEWPLHLEATDLSNTATKPIISTIPNASGTYPEIGRPEGDVTFRNIWFVSGEKGPGENPEWGQIRIMGEGRRIIAEDCLFEKDRGGFLQFRANDIKVYVTNCTFRNAGNRRMLEGNGRGICARNFNVDSLVVKNSTFYNIHDRIFRSQGSTGVHNYIEWDHNTVFNHFGRHGCFQLARVKKAVMTNNLISNPIMQGSSLALCNEQTQVDNDAFKVFTIDTLYSDTELTFSNNNIFWTQDVLDYWASNDTIDNTMAVYSEQILESIGGEAAAAETYFSEVLAFNSVPMSIYPLLEDTYADPSSLEMFDIIVEDISREGTVYDYGNIFDFSTFDAGFDPVAYPMSAVGAEDGTSVGSVDVSDGAVGISRDMVDQSGLSIYPNPSFGASTISFDLQNAGMVRLSVYDISGKEQSVLVNSFRNSGQQEVRMDLRSELIPGLYFIQLKSADGASVQKFVLK